MAKYFDAGDLEEDQRITHIGESAMQKMKVGFVVDDEPGKAERYIEKLLTRFPELQVTKRFPGPVAKCVSVIVERLKEPAS